MLLYLNLSYCPRFQFNVLFGLAPDHQDNKYTVNPLYNDIRYNDENRYNDNLNGTNL